MRAARRAAVFAMALALPACFDVQNVDPGAVIVDDFDDGDFMPAMTELGAWQCYAFNPNTNRDYRCDRTAGYLSAYGLFVEFALQDAPDGIQQHTGAGFLASGEFGAVIDLTPYRELVISMKLESGDPPIPSEARVYIEFQCKSVESETGELPTLGFFYLTRGVTPTSEWSTHRLALENWGPTNEPLHIKGGTPACLRAVDGIAIALQSGLKDGRAGRGTFFIDGLSFR